MSKEFDYEDCYRIAIEERARHQQNYNHWMNMYAIFNGALFVAFTSNGNCYFKILVSLLGIITSVLWVMSVYGYYDWIISWIKVVSFYESKLRIKEENNKKKVFIYRLFAKTKKKFPFSTQKCTKIFTISVLIGWCLLAICCLVRVFFKTKIIKAFLKSFICNGWTLIFLIALVVVILLFISGRCREELRDSHKNLKKNATANEKQLNSELEEICDFE